MNSHRRVVEAIERRDLKEAELAAMAMIDHTTEEIAGTFAGAPPVPPSRG